jgi:hypothetical protein
MAFARTRLTGFGAKFGRVFNVWHLQKFVKNISDEKQGFF